MKTKTTRNHLSGLAAALALLAGVTFAQTARADITVTGDYHPTDESVWTSGGDSGTYGMIGYNADSVGTLSITGGSTLNLNTAFLGYSANSGGFAFVTGGTWTMTNSLFVGAAGTGSLLVNGGTVSSIVTIIGYDATSNGNNVFVIGQESQLVANSLVVGWNGLNNLLTIKNGGLVKVGDNADGGTITFNYGTGANSLLQLDGGYLALYGDQRAYVASLITGGYIQLWNDAYTWWGTSTDLANYTFGYYSEEAAEALTGYSGLGGYTILTSGATAVPEPSTVALIGLSLASFAIFRRRNVGTDTPSVPSLETTTTLT